MKNIISLLAGILIFSNVAAACEAQVAGTVRSMKKTKIGRSVQCKVVINYTHFQPAALCPIDIDDVKDKEVVTKYCDRKAGDDISGYLMDSGAELYLDE